uniref:grpE protein homolog, mitochondrial-like n=1 Tax=Styela clava TaxID=7725 RepID=UPI00193A5307|nr:grpE protein homolog, mitochondrial-like [Styela clava]
MNKVILRTSQCLRLNYSDFLTTVNTPQRFLFKRAWSTAKPNQEDKAKEEPESKIECEQKPTEESAANDEIKKLNESLADLKDKYQRSIAENENVRKRLRKEISDSKLYAVQGFCKDLLDVADVLDTAVHSVPKEILDASSHPDHKEWMDFYNGVTMTKSELLNVFKRHGLVPFSPNKGDKFDPNIHEAMFQAPVPDMEPGLVAHIQTIGYTLHDRTLRPAQVGVSK